MSTFPDPSEPASVVPAAEVSNDQILDVDSGVVDEQAPQLHSFRTPFQPPVNLQRVNSYQSLASPFPSHGSPEGHASLGDVLQSPRPLARPSIWPIKFDEKDILQWLDVFFERLRSVRSCPL
jgi:hypothetical protein